MVILDWERFNALAPRSHQTLLCQCDRCKKEIYIKKSNLYRYHKDGVCLFYKANQEPVGFVPTYEYCNNCRPRRGTPRSSPETRRKISEKLTGVKIGRRQTEEGLKRLSEKRMGSRNPAWNPDREAVERKARAKKTAKNLIWNTIIRCKQKKTDRTHKLLGYSAQELVDHIESQFVEGMTWENIAIDHRIPVKAFIEHGILDMSIINHLSNLQPLFRQDNSRKGDRYREEDFQDYISQFSDLISEASNPQYQQLSLFDLM
jgi:hypothetical protein